MSGPSRQTEPAPRGGGKWEKRTDGILYDQIRQYIIADKRGERGAQEQREDLQAYLTGFRENTAAAIEALLQDWGAAKDKRRERITQDWFNPFYPATHGLGTLCYAEIAVAKGKAFDASRAVTDAGNSAAKKILSYCARYGIKTSAAIHMATGAMSGITDADIFIAKDGKALKLDDFNAFFPTYQEAKKKLESGQITQQEADEIYTTENVQGEPGSIEIIRAGPKCLANSKLGPYISEADSLIEQFETLIEGAVLAGEPYPDKLLSFPAFRSSAGRTIKGIKKTPRKKKELIPVMPGQITIFEMAGKMGFFPLIQSQPYNDLIYGLGKKAAHTDRAGNRFIDGDRIRIQIEGLPKTIKRLPTSAAKLLDCLQMKESAQGIANGNHCILPLREYMELRGLVNIKETRKQVNRDLGYIRTISETFKERSTGDYLTISPYGGTAGIKNGEIYFKFNEDWKRLFPFNQFMFIPKQVFRTNDKHNPHSYYFGRIIAEHKRKNLNKKNENIMRVKTIIDAAPEFPAYEDLGEDKQVSKRMIEPFERDMDTAGEGFFTWHYTGLEGSEGPTNYADFIDAKIQIVWGEYPPTETIKAGRKMYAKAQAKAKLKGPLNRKLGG